jgi:hydrogenase nickel incorporation protein HypA/HybF
MHELSIALGLLDVAAEEAERAGGGKVVAIHLKWGPLSGVVKEALVLAYELAREGTPLEQAELRVEEVPIVAYCPACAAEHTLTLEQLGCPVCGGPPRIVTGRELEVVALEIANE